MFSHLTLAQRSCACPAAFNQTEFMVPATKAAKSVAVCTVCRALAAKPGNWFNWKSQINHVNVWKHKHKAQLSLTAQSEYLRFFWRSFFAIFEFFTARRRLIVLQFAFIVCCCIMHWARHLLLLLLLLMPTVANVRAVEPETRESRAELRRCYRVVGRCAPTF